MKRSSAASTSTLAMTSVARVPDRKAIKAKPVCSDVRKRAYGTLQIPKAECMKLQTPTPLRLSNNNQTPDPPSCPLSRIQPHPPPHLYLSPTLHHPLTASSRAASDPSRTITAMRSGYRYTSFLHTMTARPSATPTMARSSQAGTALSWFRSRL